MNLELANLFREAASANIIRASVDQWKMINDLIFCRTHFMGGHLYRCTDCGTEQPQYNSCRNRHCPKCQGSQSAKWLKKRAAELLNVPYFHMVFTVPHELNSIILNNKEVALDLLFKAVARALHDVGKRAHGGALGFFGILHTWGGKLDFHPHIHCVVPGVVLKPDGRIEKTRSNFFLAKRRLAYVFRAVYLKFLRKVYSKGELKLHGGGEVQSFLSILEHAATVPWVVYAKKPFSSPECVLKYLARYTHRTAISNSRLQDFRNGVVTFRYRDKTDQNQKKSCSLELPEFVRRFLLHYVPRQFVRIRHFGFMANGVRTKALARLKAVFNPPPLQIADPLPPKCACCGGIQLIDVRELLRTEISGSRLRQDKTLPAFP